VLGSGFEIGRRNWRDDDDQSMEMAGGGEDEKEADSRQNEGDWIIYMVGISILIANMRCS
jgi:hypothetical protein